METIKIIEPGMLTTIQDTGRYGYMRYGIGTSGAMDIFALRIANILVGNQESEACLEITVTGPTFTFLTDTLIALTGAHFNPTIGGVKIPMWQAILAKRGTILSFGVPTVGLRAYIAIAGGIEVPMILGSKSTDLKTHMGGLRGRRIEKGDILSSGSSTVPSYLAGHLAPKGLIPSYHNQHLLRVVTGPQDDAFTHHGLETFLNSTYTITHKSDRMGYRLEGPKIEHKASPDIISDGIPFGGVQVAGDGMPIVLMADRGISGGYTKIATVIGVDLSGLAQGMPGDKVKFKAISVEQAHETLLQQERAIKELTMMTHMQKTMLRFRMSVDGTNYDVSVRSDQATTNGLKERLRISIREEINQEHYYTVDTEAINVEGERV